MTVNRSEGVPHDRLTRIVDAMSHAMESHPEYQEGDKCAIFMDSDSDRVGGLVLFGYDDDSEAMVAILTHLRAVFKANGMTLDVIRLPHRGQG